MRTFGMNLAAYLDELTIQERLAFAAKANTTDGYLAQLKGGHRIPSPRLARRLVNASNGRLSLERLRPDLWGPKAA
jgi:hypothetical protein